MASRLQADQVAGLYRRNVGAFKVATIHDGMLDTSFGDILNADRAECEAAHRAAFRSLPPRLSCNAFVIDTPGQLVLVDAGCGETAPHAGHHPKGLAALGIAPGDIDAVLMTHLHRDHAAGLLDPQGNAAFPRAELLVHEDDLAFWRDAANITRLRESQRWDFAIATAALAAYAGRVRPVGSGEVMPGISSVPTPGHTPGHTAWLLDSEGAQLLIWGDVVHLPAIQFANPEASVVYDFDHQAAAAARWRVLEMVAAEGIPVAGVHLDFPCFSRVERRHGGGFGFSSEIWTSVL